MQVDAQIHMNNVKIALEIPLFVLEFKPRKVIYRTVSEE